MHGSKRGHEINMYNGLNSSLDDELEKVKELTNADFMPEEERTNKKANIIKRVEDAMAAVTKKGREVGLIR